MWSSHVISYSLLIPTRPSSLRQGFYLLCVDCHDTEHIVLSVISVHQLDRLLVLSAKKARLLYSCHQVIHQTSYLSVTSNLSFSKKKGGNEKLSHKGDILDSSDRETRVYLVWPIGFLEHDSVETESASRKNIKGWVVYSLDCGWLVMLKFIFSNAILMSELAGKPSF